MSESSPTLELLIELLRRPSVTPEDAHCQQQIIERLSPLGFTATTLERNGVKNLWLRWGDSAPLVVFAGHTDVVPPGKIADWKNDPFIPTIHEGMLYARGAADMKASIAAFVVAAETLISEQPKHKTLSGSIALLLTSDEEGPATDGTVMVCEYLQQQGIVLDYCIVGEPTSSQQLGDTIKNGRRGSLSGKARIQGKQGHVAYPHLAQNPIHAIGRVIESLAQKQWDNGNADFPPSTFQISNIHAGTGATNVIPGEVVIDFNIRFSTESTPEQLQSEITRIFTTSGLPVTIEWTLGGEPFLTPKGHLIDALQKAIAKETGIVAQCSTSGGTSDGRFIAKICPEVVEFGPINATIHQVNECIALNDIEPLKNIYYHTLKNLLLP